MKRFFVFALALAVAVLASHNAWAQRGPGGRGFGGGGLGLLAQKSVQDELKLSDDQQKQVTEQMEKQREAFAGGQDLSREERQKRFAERQKANQETIAKILNGEQLKRFKQIDLQQRGGQALADAEVAVALALTAEQKEKVASIQESLRGEMREAFQAGAGGDREEARKKFEALQTSTNDKLKALLTPEQQAKWKDLSGEPFKGEIRRPQGRGNRGAGAGASRSLPTEAARRVFRLASFRDGDSGDNEEANDELVRGHGRHERDVWRQRGHSAEGGPNSEIWSRVAAAMEHHPRWRDGDRRPGPGGEPANFQRRLDDDRSIARHRGHHGRGAGWRGRGYRDQRFVEHRHGPGHGPHFAWHGGPPRRNFGHRDFGPAFAGRAPHHGWQHHGWQRDWHSFAGHDGPRPPQGPHAWHPGHGPGDFAIDRGPHGHDHHFTSWRVHHHGHPGQHFDPRRDERPSRHPLPPGPPLDRRGELDSPEAYDSVERLAHLERTLDGLAEQIENLRRALRR